MDQAKPAGSIGATPMRPLPLLALLALSVPAVSAGPGDTVFNAVWSVTDPVANCLGHLNCVNPCSDGCNPCREGCDPGYGVEDACDLDASECGDSAVGSVFIVCGEACDDPAAFVFGTMDEANRTLTGTGVFDTADEAWAAYGDGTFQAVNNTVATLDPYLGVAHDGYEKVRLAANDVSGFLDDTAPEEVVIDCHDLGLGALWCRIWVHRETDFGFIDLN